jgi:hypothetical protein
VAAACIDHELGDGEWADAGRASLQHGFVLGFKFAETTDTGTDHHAAPVKGQGTEVDPGIMDGLITGSECELNESVEVASFFRPK